MKRLMILIAACFATSALAEERFTIERIEVRNAQRISPSFLAAETMLREGSEVSEDDVRAGIRRLARQPFVFAADYALEPGSDATRRVVIINVRENHRYWYLADVRAVQESDPVDAVDYDFPDPAAEWKHAAAGARWLFGDGGVAHFGMTVLRNRRPLGKNYSAYELGYTRHRILGSPVFATMIVRSPVDSLEEKTFTPEVVVGMPLTADQTITLEYEDSSFRDDQFTILGNSFRRLQAERTLSASWTLDMRNEPWVATRGTFLKVEPYIWMGDRASFSNARPGQSFQPNAHHITATGFDLTAEHHWQWSDVSSVSAGVLAGWSSVRERQNPETPSSDVTWRPTFEVIKGAYARKIRSSFIELEGRVLFRQVSGAEGRGLTGTSYEIAAAWARRSPRGVLRLGFGYTQ